MELLENFEKELLTLRCAAAACKTSGDGSAESTLQGILSCGERLLDLWCEQETAVEFTTDAWGMAWFALACIAMDGLRCLLQGCSGVCVEAFDAAGVALLERMAAIVVSCGGNRSSAFNVLPNNLPLLCVTLRFHSYPFCGTKRAAPLQACSAPTRRWWAC